MGAWSHGPFDNDDAADWLSELLEQDSMTMIVDAFCAVTRPANSEDDDDYIEIWCGGEGRSDTLENNCR